MGNAVLKLQKLLPKLDRELIAIDAKLIRDALNLFLEDEVGRKERQLNVFIESFRKTLGNNEVYKNPTKRALFLQAIALLEEMKEDPEFYK